MLVCAFEGLCVSVCVHAFMEKRKRVCVCVCERERESVCERECV